MSTPFNLANLVGGLWKKTERFINVPHPMTGELLALVPDTRGQDLPDFERAMGECPIHGLHNPLRDQKRYLDLGEVCFKAAIALSDRKNADYFARQISCVMPKDYDQSMAEVVVTARFLKTFAGNNIRFLGKGETVPGDGLGHEAVHYPWPFGPVAIITPFNFPLEIPALQLMGALFMGNKPLLKPDPRVAVVADSFVKLLLVCGLSPNDLCLMHGGGEVTEALVTSKKANGEFLIQTTQFTGSTRVARHLAQVTEGRARFEDSGLGWKILGPNFLDSDVEMVAKQCDADAYAASGQKCSAQSLLFVHKRWRDKGFFIQLADLAYSRKFSDLTLGPTLTWDDQRINDHCRKVLSIPGAHLLFGGQIKRSADRRSVPNQYGCFGPTALEVPLDQMIDPQNLEVVTTELFGPFQIVVTWETKEDLEKILNFLNELPRHLTAAVVDRDPNFLEYVLGRTKPGTTYAGIKAPTTGAPEWHHFGPTGHPADCGIGTSEAIIRTWSQTRLVCRRGDGLLCQFS